jgi:hypothetical protein
MRVHDPDDQEVGERADQTIDLVDDDSVDFLRGDIGEELLEGWTVERSARVPTVVEQSLDETPPLTPPRRR